MLAKRRKCSLAVNARCFLTAEFNEAFKCGTKNKRMNIEYKIQQQRPNMSPQNKHQRPPIALMCFIVIIIVHSIFTLVNGK